MIKKIKIGKKLLKSFWNMKLLLIEDVEEKIIEIEKVLKIHERIKVTKCASLDTARRALLQKKYDLIVFDIFLPLRDGDVEAFDISAELLLEFSKGINCKTEAITITKCDVSDVENMRDFNELGVTVVTFDLDSEKWKDSLEAKINKILSKPKYDFLIFCALPKERNAYSKTVAKIGNSKSIRGINCQEMLLGGVNGLCILPARSGLVHMAITAAKAIEIFEPTIVAMSGICAGAESETNFLNLLVGEICWEYQTGKFKDNYFYQEPYQVSLDPDVKTSLELFIENSKLDDSLTMGLYESELKNFKVSLVPLSSGSAVIADERKMQEIGEQHRKMAGLEMEMYSLYEAAKHATCKPEFFGAKAVVDMGDNTKGDKFHLPACILSARFVSEYLVHRFNELDEE
jgi:adenosylhomocysteine nucleosidase